jgi:hypothetical protein
MKLISPKLYALWINLCESDTRFCSFVVGVYESAHQRLANEKDRANHFSTAACRSKWWLPSMLDVRSKSLHFSSESVFY